MDLTPALGGQAHWLLHITGGPVIIIRKPPDLICEGYLFIHSQVITGYFTIQSVYTVVYPNNILLTSPIAATTFSLAAVPSGDDSSGVG